MKLYLPKKRVAAFSWALPFVAFATTLSPVSAQETEDEVFELSPFSVEAADNEGYRATSTLAGTRIKSELRDIGSSVSILTDELFEDTGATDASTILSYATNVEVGGVNGNFADAQFTGGRANPSDQQRMPQNSQRVRGLAEASLTRGYFLTDIPFDNYNSDRVTINRGPNSLLFGIGKPGGVINNAVNQASLGKDFGEVSVRFGERGSYRTTLDVNRVLIEDRLSLRLSALKEKTEYQQRPTYEDDSRVYAAFEGVLFKNESSDFFDRTVLKGNYENGTIKGTPPSILPPVEGISDWFSLPDRDTYEAITGTTLPAYFDDGSWSSKMIVDTSRGANFATVPAPVGDLVTIQMPLVYATPGAQAPSIGLSDPSIAGAMGRVIWQAGVHPGFDERFDTIGSRSVVVQGFLPGFTAPTINDTGIFDNRNIALGGELNFVESDFDATNVALEQTFWGGKAGFEVAFDTQSFNNFAQLPFDAGSGSNNSALDLWVDMNTHLSNGDENPNVGRVAIRNRGTPRRVTQIEREATRLTAFGEVDFTNRDTGLKNLGRHVFTGMHNTQEIDSDLRNYQYTWGDASADTDVFDILFTNKSGGRILVPSIYYLTDSLTDPSIQSFSDVRIDQPITAALPQAGDIYKVHYNTRPPVINGDGSVGFIDDFLVEDTLWSGNHTRQEVTSQVVSWQSFFFDGNIVGLVGWRRDEAENFEKIGTNSTRLPNGELDPAGFELKADPSTVVEKDTLTKSLVAHLPMTFPGGTEISFHYNESENFEPVGVRRDALNQIVSNPVSETKEYGITFEFFDRKMSARLNWFETVNDFGPAAVGGSASGGVTYLMNTVTSFYRRDAELSGALTASEASDGLFDSYGEIYDAFESLVPADVLAAYELDLTIPTAPGFSVGSIQGLMAPQSFISEGIELELAGAITPNWNVFMNISKQESTVSNIADSAFELASEIAAKAKANGVWEMRQSPSVGSAITVGQQLTNNFLVPLAGAKTREGTVAAEQRKWRMNLTSTYKFTEGKMKGLGFGGALRWQDAAATGYRLNINSEGIQVPDLNSPFYGPEEFNGDVWVNYRRPLKDGKIDWKVQLNVRNLIGDSDMIPVVTNPDGRVAISRNPNPKEVFLTNTFSF